MRQMTPMETTPLKPAVPCRNPRVYLASYATALVLLLLASISASARTSDSVNALKRKARSDEAVESCQAMSELAAYYRTHDELRKTRRIIDPFTKPSPATARYPQVLVFAEATRCYTAAGELAEALRMIGFAEPHTDEIGTFILAEAKADCFRQVERWAEARDLYTESLEHCRAVLESVPKGSAAMEEFEKSPRFREARKTTDRIHSKLAQVKEQLDIQELGLDFVLFRKADTYRIRGDLEQAAAIYTHLIESVPESIYAHAAEFLRHHCITGRRAVAKQFRYLERFYNNNPGGLYRGEALLKMGELYLLHEFDADKAREKLELAVVWARKMRENKRTAESEGIPTVPDKSRDACAPPQTPYAFTPSKVGQGLLSPVVSQPGTLVNRRTAPWYLDHLEERAHLGLAFCFMTDDDWERARDEVDAMLTLNPQVKSMNDEGVVSVYYRLREACEQHRIVTETEEFKGMDRRLKLRVMYADFLYLQTRFKQALDILKQTHKIAADKRDKTGQAVTLVAQATVMIMLDPEDPQIDALLETVVADFPREVAAGRAHLYIANRPIPYDTDAERVQTMNNAIRHYDEARELGADTFFGEQAAMLGMVATLDAGNKQDAVRRAKSILKSSQEDSPQQQRFVRTFIDDHFQMHDSAFPWHHIRD